MATEDYRGNLSGVPMLDYNTSDVNVSSACIENKYLCYTTEQFRQDILDYIFPKFYQWIFIGLFIIVFVVGIGGNFLVCYAVWKSHHLRTVTNYFLVNLAGADFMVILICLAPTVTHDIAQSWFLGAAMCKIVTYLQYVSVFVSVLTLTAISIERYLAICHPLTYRGTKFKTRLALIVIWLVAGVTPIPVFFTIDVFHDELVPETLRPLLSRCGPTDGERELQFTLFLTVAFFFIPLFIMAYAYVQIARCLWSSTLLGGVAAAESLQNNSEQQLKARRRTAKMLIVVLVAFGLCYLPVYLLNIARYLKLTEQLAHNLPALYTVTLTAHWLSYFNSAINPVIYNFMSGKFRKQFRVVCFGCYSCCKCCCQREEDKRSSAESQAYKSYAFNKSRTLQLTTTSISDPRKMSMRSFNSSRM